MKLAKMKVVEMRKELDARGLNSSGTRPTLMKRLREALNREEEKKALEQDAHEVPNVEPPQQSANDEIPGEEHDRETPSPREAVATSLKDAPDAANQQNGSPKEQVAAASDELAPNATQSPPKSQTDEPVTTGSIGRSSELSMDERMRKRRERFGAVSNAPDTTDNAIERRRKRFGAVEKAQAGKPAKRRRPSNEVDEQALKEHEEAKKRRAIKFGVSLNTRKEPPASDNVSADEMEKRLRRQRRFQQVGS